MKKLLLIALFLPLAQIHAQMLEIRGIGDAKVVDATGKPLPPGEGAKQAVRAAAINSIDQLLEAQSSNIRQQFNERVKGSVEREEEVKGMINDLKVVVDPIPEQKIVRVRIVGSLDLNTLKDKMNQWTKINTQVVTSSKKAAIFFSLVQTASTEKGIVKIKTEDHQDKGRTQSGTEQLEAGGVQVQEKESTTDTKIEGIARIETADKTTSESNDRLKNHFGTGLMTQFASKGFDGVIDGASEYEAAVELDMDFNKTGKPTPKTWRKLIQEIKELSPDVEMIVVGHIDFSAATEDPVTGMRKVETTMFGEVYKIDADPKSSSKVFIAGLANKNRSATANIEEDAKKRALEAMAPLAADEIISQLNNKDLLK
jgi:hypothetical protein